MELVRLIMVGLFAMAGWTVTTRIGKVTTGRLALGVFLGAGIGFVLGGVFGRHTASAATRVEREFRRIPAPEILAGAVGLVVALLPAALLSIPIFHLPPTASFPSVALLYYVCGYLGYHIGRSKSDELFAMFGVKTRAAGTREGEVLVLDTSAILDGRIESLIRMGFLSGTMLVSRRVLGELQAVADSSDPTRRTRGKKALDMLVALRRDPTVDVHLVDDEKTSRTTDVDAALVRLAKDRGAALVTNDANLAKVAQALDVQVRSIHALADAMRPPVTVGERVNVRLIREGRESGQGVGYLDDGTMVVVERASRHIGDTVTLVVTNVLQTSNGQLVFGKLADMRAAEPPVAGSAAS
ncbi:MAG TPA: PIN domain-containing protein [Actinomycetota bacterium]|nr:PIN domain-containing protein [Actinomycetota bacterium]